MKQLSAGPLEVGLVQRWKEYRSLLKASRTDVSEIAIHDLRVSGRRMLGALEIVRAVQPTARVRRVRRSIKSILDALDDLRDVQVMLLELSKTPESLPLPAGFAAGLQHRETRLLGKARKELRAARPSGLQKRVRRLRDLLRKRSFEEGAALRAVDGLFGDVAATAARIDEADPAAIHAARIAFKKFRYAVEVVAPLLSGYPIDHFARMHSYQGRLGEVHDMDILLTALSAFNRKSSPAGAEKDITAEPLRGHFEARRVELIAVFRRDKDDLSLFWRGTPDQAFPWEANHEAVPHPSRDRRSDRPGRRRQPATPDREGPDPDVSDRAGPEGVGRVDRPDPDQPLPARPPDSPHPGKET